jgi:hypothetical protein
MRINELYCSLKEFRKYKGVRVFYPFNVFSIKRKNLIDVYIFAQKYSLKKELTWWYIIYSERNEDFLIKKIRTENEATTFFYNLIVSKISI